MVIQTFFYLLTYKAIEKVLCSTQLALLSLTEKWKKVLDINGFEGAVLTDLSINKLLDIINHKLKPLAYGFDKSSLKTHF